MADLQQAQEERQLPRKRRRWPGRLIGAVFSVVFTLVFVGGATLFLLITTEEGLRLGFQVSKGVLPEGISIDRVEGRLAGPLTLHGIHYRDQSLDLRIGRLRLEWQLQALFGRKLRIQLVELEAVAVEAMGGQEEGSSEPLQLPEIVLPIDLELELARIDGIRVATAGEAEPLVIELLELGAGFTHSTLVLSSFLFEMPQLSVRSQGQVQLQGDYPLSLALNWSFHGLPGAPVAGRGVLSGSLQALTLRQSLENGVRAQLALQLKAPLDMPSIEADLQLEHLNPAELDPQLPKVQVSGDIALSGGLEALALTGSLTGSAEEFGRLENRFDLSWENGSLVLKVLEAKGDNGLVMRASGRWAPGEAGIIEARGDWESIVWPLVGAPQVRSPKGRFNVTGTPADYQFLIDTVVLGQGIPEATLSLGGRGGMERVNLERMQIDTLEGQVTGVGRLAWSPQIDWEFTIDAAGINPGAGWADWPGDIGGQILGRGALAEGRPSIQLKIPSVNGRLRDYPINLEGSLAVEGEALRIDGLSLVSGSSRLQVEGGLTDRWDLNWRLQSEDLGTLLPNAGGKITASGALQGARNQPGVKASVKGEGLRYQRYGITRLGGEIDFRPQGGDRILVQVAADDIDLGGPNRWQSIKLDGNGTLGAHRLELSAEGELARLLVKLNAGLDAGNLWQGQLQAMNISNRDLGDWQLDSPAPFALGPDRVRIDKGCLRDGEGRICVTADGVGSAFKGSVQLERFSLERLKLWLPPGVEMTGMVNGDTRFDLSQGGALEAAGKVAVPRGRAVMSLGAQQRTLDFSGSGLSMRVDQAGLAADLNVPLNQNGIIEGRLQLPGWTPDRADGRDQMLKGRIRARMDDLGLFSGLVQGLSGLHGRLDMDLGLSGSLDRPGIKGHAWLKEGGMQYTPLGISLQQIELEASNRGLDELAYQGGLLAGKGQLEISGSTRFDTPAGIHTDLVLRGENLTAVDIPEAWVLVSPNLEIGIMPRRVDVNGEVAIPQARIRPRALPESAVAASPDVRFVGESTVEEAPPAEVNASVRVRLGDKVSFDGFGLRGLIRGDLLVTDEPGKPTLGSGQISIASGTYKAYGQDLEIRQGRAIFANSLITNPGIVVKAVRTTGDIEAGVNVTGTLKKPKLQVISTPAMAQSEALSYLILGRPPGRTATADDSARMQSAASALMASGGGLLAAEIGRQFGLDEFGFQSSGENDELALHLGAYLSPRLYIQYISELATAANQVKMRYDLTERIQIQTETGTVHGGDIFYTIER